MGCGGSKNAVAKSSTQATTASITGSNSSPDTIEIDAKPAFVIKLAATTKIFINVYGDSRVSKIFIYPKVEKCLDRKGAESLLYSVLLPERHAFNPETRPVTSEGVIRAVSHYFAEDFDFEHYSLPSIVKGFMGDNKVPVFEVPRTHIVSQSTGSVPVKNVPELASSNQELEEQPRLNPSPDPAQHVTAPAPSASVVNVPEAAPASAPVTSAALPEHPENSRPDKDNEFNVIPSDSPNVPDGVRFWTEEKEPGLFHVAHHRYFVVDNGKYSVYRRSIAHPPYGNDLIGSYSLSGCKVAKIDDKTLLLDGSHSISGGHTNRIHFESDSSRNFIMLTIERHIEYAELLLKSKISSTFTTSLNNEESSSGDAMPSDGDGGHAPARLHTMGMRCCCAHQLGICHRPLDESIHHNDDCLWLCCGELWHNPTCSQDHDSTEAKPPKLLRFTGEKKGHISTARLRRYFVVEHGELKYFADGLPTPPYGKDLKGSIKLRGYNIETTYLGKPSPTRIYLAPTIKSAKDLDIEIDDRESVRDFIVSELRRHVELANTLFSDEEVMSTVRRTSISQSISNVFAIQSSKSSVADIVQPLHGIAETALPPAPSSGSTTSQSSPSSPPPPAADVTSNSVIPPTFELGAAAATAVAAVEAPVSAPLPIKFWAQKKGHINLGMKPRYFVLHAGLLSYYAESVDSPPFGKDFKGSHYLANFEVVDLSTLPANQSNELRILIRDKTDHSKDLDLQFAVRALKVEVEASLAAHIEYATKSHAHDESVREIRSTAAGTSVTAETSTSSPVSPISRASAAPSARRSSMFSFGASSAPAVAANDTEFPAPYHLTAEDRNKWSIFVPRGEAIVATALVNKPNPVGKTLMRQLILTTGSKLLYVDPDEMTLKGTIDVTRGVSLWQICKPETNMAFLIREAKGKREYKFIDSVYGSAFWTKVVANGVLPDDE